jgi:hypothetical protein
MASETPECSHDAPRHDLTPISSTDKSAVFQLTVDIVRISEEMIKAMLHSDLELNAGLCQAHRLPESPWLAPRFWQHVTGNWDQWGAFQRP